MSNHLQQLHFSELQARKPEAGYALQVSTLGNHLNDKSVTIAVSLHLGIAVGAGHKFTCAGGADELGHHALNRNRCTGRYS